MNHSVSAIIPTIGRPDSLRRLLDSLTRQTAPLHEIIIADASSDTATAALLTGPALVGTPSSASPYQLPSSASHCQPPPDERTNRWPPLPQPSPPEEERESAHRLSAGSWVQCAKFAYSLPIRRLAVHPPNAVRQRLVAITAATGSHLLLLDDDVVLEPDCVEQLLAVFRFHPDAVAAVADFTNQPWPGPTRLWRFYLRRVLRLSEGTWQGRVLGPLLRFGYSPSPPQPMPMDWLGAGNSLVLRSAYERVGGFSDFFLHRCTMNEDVDLGLKLSRLGRIYLCPGARMRHEQAPGGRASPTVITEDDLYNRFLVLHHTMGKSGFRALGLVLLFCSVETLSNIYHSLRRFDLKHFLSPLIGRARALLRIAVQIGSSRMLKNAPGEGTGPTGL